MKLYNCNTKHFVITLQKLMLTMGLVAAMVLAQAGCSSSRTQNPGIEIEPFSSDGCSLFPDGTLSQRAAWKHCCYDHDKSYWPGGSRFERLAADRQLASCVAEAGFPLTSKLMYAGVRAGGTPYIPTPFRWGFGWPWFHGYD